MKRQLVELFFAASTGFLRAFGPTTRVFLNDGNFSVFCHPEERVARRRDPRMDEIIILCGFLFQIINLIV